MNAPAPMTAERRDERLLFAIAQGVAELGIDCRGRAIFRLDQGDEQAGAVFEKYADELQRISSRMLEDASRFGSASACGPEAREALRAFSPSLVVGG